MVLHVSHYRYEYFSLYLMFSRFGNIKLGKENDEPDFSLSAWFSMLFSAGMGVGLMFFSTEETVSHAFISSPNTPPRSEQAIVESLQYTVFHRYRFRINDDRRTRSR